MNTEKIIEKKNELESKNENNLIKNLKYDVNFDDGTKYNITAELSELTNEQNNEVVKMQNVTAIFIDKGNLPLIITSDYAVFDNKTYNSLFRNNVSINYINNSINSEKLFLDFEENVITINDNIIYEGANGIGKADNIKINLTTKNVQIFMNDSNKKVEVISK